MSGFAVPRTKEHPKTFPLPIFNRPNKAFGSPDARRHGVGVEGAPNNVAPA